MHDILAEELRTDSTAVSSDAVTAHLGALGPGPGATLAVGTGAVAVACDDVGRWHLADGIGPHVGDNGSGAWIGRRGLDAAARSMDSRHMGASPGLVQAAEEHFGRREQWTTVNDVSLFAGFAPQVVTGGGPRRPGVPRDPRRGGPVPGGRAVRGAEPPRRRAGRGHHGEAPDACADRSGRWCSSGSWRSATTCACSRAPGLPLDGALSLARMLAAHPAVVREHVPLLAVRIGTSDWLDDSVTLPRRGAPGGPAACARRASPPPGRSRSGPTSSGRPTSCLEGIVGPATDPTAAVVPLTGARLVVGRASRSRGVVPGHRVRGHRRVPPALRDRLVEGGWSVVDLGSANGTYVAARGEPVPGRTAAPRGSVAGCPTATASTWAAGPA